MDYWSDFIVGTAAAINVEIGFIPDVVRVTNLSDHDTIVMGFPNTVLAFDTGKVELKAGDLIVGHSSGAKGIVKKVMVHTGSFGGSTDASGFLVLEHEERDGTFVNNDNLQVASQKGNYGLAPVVSDTVSAITSAAESGHETRIGAAVAAAAANETIAPYDGTTAGAGKGVTLGSAISENNDLLLIEAWRTGPS